MVERAPKYRLAGELASVRDIFSFEWLSDWLNSVNDVTDGRETAQYWVAKNRPLPTHGKMANQTGMKKMIVFTEKMHVVIISQIRVSYN